MATKRTSSASAAVKPQAAKRAKTSKPVTPTIKPKSVPPEAPASSAPPVAVATQSGDVAVKMFCQGLGDCFLITVPQGDGQPDYTILIDCGVAKGTPQASKLMAVVVGEIGRLTNNSLDLLIVTHQHWDHISSFLQVREQWNKFTVKNVWYAWTEDPKDDLANSLKGQFAKVKKTVERALQAVSAMDAVAQPGNLRAGLVGALAFQGLYAAADDGVKEDMSTAMGIPAKLAKGNVRYLRPGESPKLPGAKGPAAALQLFSLGPPHDQNKLVRINPSARNPETYEKEKSSGKPAAATEAPAELGFNWTWTAALNMAVDSSVYSETKEYYESLPFDNTVGILWKDLNTYSVSSSATGPERSVMDFFYENYFKKGDANDGRRIDGDWMLGGAQRLALQMDSYTNNTSLALAIRLPASKKVLLFAADAQVGNWLSWYDQTYTDPDGKQLTAEDLLRNTVLYKVGHHGSHNASLREKGVECMTHPDLVAMLPVEVEGAVRLRYNGMPLPTLVDALGKITSERILQIDKSNVENLAGTWPDTLIKARKAEKTFGSEGCVGCAASARPLFLEYAVRDA